ncbi:MAG: hypothetical protein HY902_18020 [Deltaproteobacteria bacterium]|nr:hypothetical protein [Deltaproteobacteria bacterium]
MPLDPNQNPEGADPGRAAEAPPEFAAALAGALALAADGQYAQAADILRQLLQDPAAADPELGALLASHLAELLAALSQPSEARQVLGKYLAMDLDGAVRARLLCQAATVEAEPRVAIAFAAEADRLATALADPRPRVATLQVLLTLLVTGGHTQGVRVVGQGLIDQGHLAGDRGAQVQGACVLAEQAEQDGDRGQALEYARQAHGTAQLLPPEQAALRAAAAGLRARLAVQGGHFVEAIEASDLGLGDLAWGDAQGDELRLWRALAQLGLDPENPSTAAELRDLARRTRPELAALAQAALDAMQANQEPSLSHADAALWIAEAQANRDPHRELQGRLARAQALLAQERSDEARQDARIAAQLAAELLQPVAHAQARWVVAQVLTAQGLYRQARAELTAAHELAERLGVARVTAACRQWQAHVDEAERASR